jgi:hypothetical protein
MSQGPRSVPVMEHDASETGPGPGRRPRPDPARVEQPALPFPEDAGDEPIPYALTARARRQVAPTTLPDLAVVPVGEPAGGPAGAGDVDPFDTRPARARALRRSGRGVEEIAAALRVDADLVTRWCRGVRPAPPRRGRPGSGRQEPLAHPAGAVRARDGSGPWPPRAAVEAAVGALAAGDAPAVLGAGLVVGLAQLTAHAVTLITSDPPLVAAALAWLRDHAGVEPGRVRVRLQTGRGVARDLAAHAWARALDLPPEQVTHAPWPAAPGPEAVRATVRVAAPDAAAVVGGWREALLDAEAGASGRAADLSR